MLMIDLKKLSDKWFVEILYDGHCRDQDWHTELFLNNNHSCSNPDSNYWPRSI